MQSPEDDIPKGSGLTTLSVIEVPPKRQSPTDTVRNLTDALSGHVATFTSPIREADVGQPQTPERRLVVSIDEQAIDQGYDSDGCRGPWEGNVEEIFNAVELEEDPLPTAPPPSLPVEVTTPIEAEKICAPIDVKKMKVKEIQNECMKRGLSKQGKKDELVRRLTNSLERGDSLVQNLSPGKAKNLAGDSFSPGAY